MTEISQKDTEANLNGLPLAKCGTIQVSKYLMAVRDYKLVE